MTALGVNMLIRIKLLLLTGNLGKERPMRSDDGSWETTHGPSLVPGQDYGV